MYFLIRSSEGDVSIEALTKEGLMEALVEDEEEGKSGLPVNEEFAKLKAGMVNYDIAGQEGWILIKGEYANLKKVQVEKYVIE